MKRLRKISKKLDITICRYWLPITLGFIVSGIFVLVEKDTRGKFAIGGEWLFPVWFCLIHYMARTYFREKKRRAKQYGRIPKHPQAARR